MRHILLSGREADRRSLRPGVGRFPGYSSRPLARGRPGRPPPRRRRPQTGQGPHRHHPHHTDQHPGPAGLLRRQLHPAPAGELPPRAAVHDHVRRHPGPTPSGLTPRPSAIPGPTQHHPDTPTTDRAIPATPHRPLPIQDQLPDSKINWRLRGGFRLRQPTGDQGEYQTTCRYACSSPAHPVSWDPGLWRRLRPVRGGCSPDGAAELLAEFRRAACPSLWSSCAAPQGSP